MKRIVIVLIIVPLLLAGCKSREEKAAAFAESNIKKMLNDASTYEPVETLVDSAFNNIYLDPEANQAAVKINKINGDIDFAKSQYRSEKSSLAIWSDPYQTAFGREKARQAKEKMEEIEEKIKKLEAEKEENVEIIKKRNQEIVKPEFCGWGITHTYRIENGFGVKSLRGIILISDKDFKNLKHSIPLDEYSNDGVIKIKETIDEVIANN